MAKIALDTDLKAIQQVRSALAGMTSAQQFRVLDFVRATMNDKEPAPLTLFSEGQDEA